MRKGPDANTDDGLLQIELQLELPEAMKPHRIDIKNGKPLPKSHCQGR
jgi:HSP20 family molecular chaperone IbpA